MSIFHAIVLGIVQGLSEFLPISSSGHLILIPALLGWDIQTQVFDIVIHLGTLCAVLIYFRKKIFSILQALVRFRVSSPERTLGFSIILATIPAAIVGFFFGDSIESLFRSSHSVAVSLMVGAVLLFLADRYSTIHAAESKDISEIGFRHGFVIGLAQVIAFIPGMSRSGVTISAGLVQKISKTAAAEFSFLMSIPVIALAGASALRDILSQGGGFGISTAVFVWGFVAAAVSGFISIWLTLKIVKKMSFTPFVVYRILIGISILLFVV